MHYYCLAVVILIIFVLLIFKFFIIPSPKRFELCGSHVLITGGSSGIGRSLAEQIFKLGANVTLLARDVKKLAETKTFLLEHVKSNGKNVVQYFSTDISSNYDEVKKVMNRAEEKLGPVDVLINSAGFSIAETLENTDVDQLKNLMDLNYFGSIYCTKAVIGQMKIRKRGRIVLVSSQAGQMGLFGYAGYSASKFALRGLAESLQMEMLPHNVRVCLVFPPDTKTPGYEEEMKHKPLETRLISESSGLHGADHVAEKVIMGIMDGTFSIYVGLEGLFMNHLTAGMSPATNFVDALVQVTLMGVLRLVALVYICMFNRIVLNCARNNNNNNNNDNINNDDNDNSNVNCK